MIGNNQTATSRPPTSRPSPMTSTFAPTTRPPPTTTTTASSTPGIQGSSYTKYFLRRSNQMQNAWNYYFLILGTIIIDCDSPLDTVVTVPGSTIISPNYPNDYENNEDCAITIRFPERVRLTFLAFDIEESSDCSWDYMQFFDGPTSTSPQIATTVCGSIAPQPLESSGRTMSILFHSDHSIRHTGFKIFAESGNTTF